MDEKRVTEKVADGMGWTAERVQRAAAVAQTCVASMVKAGRAYTVTVALPDGRVLKEMRGLSFAVAKSYVNAVNAATEQARRLAEEVL